MSADGLPVTSVDQLHKLMVTDAIGRRIRFGIVRGGQQLDVELVPAELEG